MYQQYLIQKSFYKVLLNLLSLKIYLLFDIYQDKYLGNFDLYLSVCLYKQFYFYFNQIDWKKVIKNIEVFDTFTLLDSS